MEDYYSELISIISQSLITMISIYFGYRLGIRQDTKNKKLDNQYKFLFKVFDNIQSYTLLTHNTHTTFERVVWAVHENNLREAMHLYKIYRDDIHTYYMELYDALLLIKIKDDELNTLLDEAMDYINNIVKKNDNFLKTLAAMPENLRINEFKTNILNQKKELILERDRVASSEILKKLRLLF